MKLSLDSISYVGAMYNGPSLPLEEVIKRAAKFGYDGFEIWGNRPHGLYVDLDQKARKAIAELARSKGLGIAAIGAATDFSLPHGYTLNDHRPKELAYIKEECKLASDLGTKVVRVFAAWMSHGLYNVIPGIGYADTWPGTSEWPEGSTYSKQWKSVMECLKEAAKYAKEYGVYLALQNHPPLFGVPMSYRDQRPDGNLDTLDMITAVNEENLKMSLDVPLFRFVVKPGSSWDAEYIKWVVEKVGKIAIHSHISSCFLPEKLRDADYRTFFSELKKMGYSEWLSYEQCGPVYAANPKTNEYLPEHQIADLAEVDRRSKLGQTNMREILDSI